MEDNNNAGLSLIRKNGVASNDLTDSDILNLVLIGDSIRSAMSPNVEVDYDETQQKAIQCSLLMELANDKDLDDFDEEAFDKAFDAEFA